MKIGLLALQGAVEPHRQKLERLGVEPVEVRHPSDLSGLAGIILPGGESTTMIHLLKLHDLWMPLAGFASERPAWGICAGAILLASRVTGPEQVSLGLFDVWAERNAYGRQKESFIAPLDAEPGSPGPFEGIFIRAPRFRDLGLSAQVVYRFRGEPVMATQDHLWITSFHPELTPRADLHERFVSFCRGKERSDG